MERLNQFKNFLKSHGKSDATCEAYISDTKRFMEYCAQCKLAILNLNADHISEFVFNRQEHGKTNSARRALLGIRQYYRFLATIEKNIFNPTDDVVIPNRIEHRRSSVDHIVFENLMAAAGQQISSLKSSRDQALLCLLGMEGIKASELIELTWSQLVMSGAEGSLRIKGQRPRTITLNSETITHLRLYRSIFQANGDYVSTGNMFIAFKGKHSSVHLTSLTRHGVKFTLYELGDHCKIQKLNSEELRSFAIRSQFQSGKTLDQVMAHLGLRTAGQLAAYYMLNNPLDYSKMPETSSTVSKH